MKFFPIYDYQLLALTVFFGVILVIYLYMAFGGPRRRSERSAMEIDLDDQEMTIEEKTEDNPPAPLLLLIYAGIIIWCIGYIVIVGIMGGPIG